MKNLFLTFLISATFLTGCASIRDAKKYEMKKSPCACFDMEILEVKQLG